MRHGDKGPVGDDAINPLSARMVLLDDQVLAARGVEELHIIHREQLGHKGRREQSSVLDDDVASFIIERNADLNEQVVCRLADHHAAHQLATQPGTATGSHAGFQNGDAQIGTLLSQRVGARESGRARANDDDVRNSGVHHVGHVARSHSARSVRLLDLGKSVVASEVLDRLLARLDRNILLVLGSGGSGRGREETALAGLEGTQLRAARSSAGGVDKRGSRRRHSWKRLYDWESEWETLREEEGGSGKDIGQRCGFIYAPRGKGSTHERARTAFALNLGQAGAGA